jgi:nucleotide-binding universal stress UspA family protein
MTQEIKRILYATDLSDNSVYAFGYAINLAKKYDAEITILHVIDKFMDVSEEIKNRLKKFIDSKVADDLESAGIAAAIEICHGYPADEILKHADALHSDLIVIGTHGKGILSQAFFGSVAKKVLRLVRKPVFIIPLPEK